MTKIYTGISPLGGPPSGAITVKLGVLGKVPDEIMHAKEHFDRILVPDPRGVAFCLFLLIGESSLTRQHEIYPQDRFAACQTFNLSIMWRLRIFVDHFK